MDLYLVIVIIMLILAVSGLVVGVANDAVNFLNSALGSKAAPRYVIMTVASIGIIIGAITSSGMMEVARSGVFHPALFSFAEVMLLFLAVMFTNVILLDLFNTLGMPTSTTVSLVFGLLGAAVGICIFKITNNDVVLMSDGTVATMSDMINTGNAMAIIGGILISVVIAFVCGTIIMYITRLIFSFRYERKMRSLGAIWCGIALTAISYFALFKGLKGTAIMPADLMEWINGHTALLMGCVFVCWSVLMSLLSAFKVNILRITVLAGTFSLALAFAGNDLVNFIGVFVAGFDAYKIVNASGDTQMLMDGLNQPVVANVTILFISGAIMVVTLWFSKKARSVSDTEINLARQDVGVERFGSTSISRAIVRATLNFNRNYEKYTPEHIQRFVESRFIPVATKDRAPFDMIRATVNLTVASLLISMATSLQLPLSTTYVTFMVAMGSSLSDRAWGRESAVYRITGVLTVIAG
ncbi:MAG: inorganic phosphate transporter, partial [Alistipes sp.]|nr:inorganic phosphate transporter [Alistipes sp.]